MASIKRIGTDSLGIPVWEAVYRLPGGKQIRRRFHVESRAEVEREVKIDSRKSGIGLKWSEGLKVYRNAKVIEGVGDRSLENVDRAVSVFIGIAGDIPIEDTSEAIMKEFMQTLATKPRWSEAVKKKRIPGPKVANESRLKLMTVAKYLLKHTTQITTIPFIDVPPLPAKAAPRTPIPERKVNSYLDALPPHLRRPVLMVLYYGLRSTAVCDLTLDSIRGDTLVAHDKMNVTRQIPIDEFLAGIIIEAKAYRAELVRASEARCKRTPRAKPLVLANRLFVNAKGRGWTRSALLHAAQKAWDNAGLEKKKIHEIRHTLGTIAGREFTPGMVQAVMGHRSRKSAEAYFHPTEEMAAEVRKVIITKLSQDDPKHPLLGQYNPSLPVSKDNHISCPFLVSLFFKSSKIKE